MIKPIFCIFLCCIILTSCHMFREERPVITQVSFDDIPSWQTMADREQALLAFRQSCKVSKRAPLQLYGHKVSLETWQRLCDIANTTHISSRSFFENYFIPYRVTTTRRKEGLLTGYFTVTLRGSLTQTEQYNVPIYAAPAKNIRTRYSRAAIEQGALKGRAQEILWLDDKVAAFFLHIQGSGFVTLPNGDVKKLSYAGKNEFPYTAIGRQFVKDGVVSKEDMSMQWLVSWLNKNPNQADEVMQRNASYIFFALEDNANIVKGAEASILTAMHSIAIDPDYISYGLPFIVQQPVKDIATIAIAQDTGSAIKGPIRADLYTGIGDEAAAFAGQLKNNLTLFALMPNADILLQ